MASIKYSARNLSADDADCEITVWHDNAKIGGTSRKLLDKEVGAGQSKSKDAGVGNGTKMFTKVEIAGNDIEIDVDPNVIARINVVFTADKTVEVTVIDANQSIVGAYP